MSRELVVAVVEPGHDQGHHLDPDAARPQAPDRLEHRLAAGRRAPGRCSALKALRSTFMASRTGAQVVEDLGRARARWRRSAVSSRPAWRG